MNGVGTRRFLATVIAAAVGLSSVLGSQTAAAQTRSRLDPRIPAPIASKYKDILDAKDWLNPSILIRSEGIEVVSRGLPGRRKTVPTTALRDLLVSLPLADWPYGRVVMASDIGLRRADRSDDESIQRNHDAAERILKDLDVTVDWWPSAAPVQATTHRPGADMVALQAGVAPALMSSFLGLDLLLPVFAALFLWRTTRDQVRVAA
jgi:hypothetical protein